MGARERSVGDILAQVVALSRSVAADRRTPFEGVELTSSQLSLLFLLAHSQGPVTPSAAASVLGVTRGAVTQLVDGLRAAGLVESVPNPRDHRSRILQLTGAERRRVADYEAGVVRRLMPGFDALDDADVHTLAGLLRRVAPQW